MLVLEGLGQEEIISNEVEEEVPSMLLKPRPKRDRKRRKGIDLFKPRERYIYDPACQKRCTDALNKCLTGCRI